MLLKFVLVIHCCITLPQSLVVKTTNIITSSEGHKSKSGLDGCFWLKAAHKVAVRCQPGLQSSEYFTRAGSSASNITPGFWQEASVPRYVDLSTRLLEFHLQCKNILQSFYGDQLRQSMRKWFVS